MDKLIAHIDPNDGGRQEPLADHLLLTAEFAFRFAEAFHSEHLAALVACVHDFGKASDEFQRYIRVASGECGEDDGGGSVAARHRGPDHSSAGAQFLAANPNLPGIGRLLAYIVAGHHAGLPDGFGPSVASLSARLRKSIPEWKNAFKTGLGSSWFDFDSSVLAQEIRPFLADGYACAFWVRMLFSCLVDGDFLATEAFMNKTQASVRNSIERPQLDVLQEELSKYYTKVEEAASSSPSGLSPVNQVRREVKEDCIRAGELPPGLFTLTVPTGGGKTLASMAFALRHAVKYGLCRVIYVIPFTNIIEQNAAVFRKVFGEHAVLECHSNAPIDEDHMQSRLLAENWDAPVIVTTDVQFFESIHSNKPSRCRKLHNLAQTVIIFDEAQTLPIDLLRPSLRALDELTIRYGSSIVLCTATQPAVLKSQFEGGLSGNGYGCREIIVPGRDLHRRLHRVEIEHRPAKMTDAELVVELSGVKIALVIVNTRRHARALDQQLKNACPPNSVFHLSAQMCPEHRKVILAKVQERLKADAPCHLVSTQLIEAGVDIDFPVVYRDLAGVDSAAQAAGRCNREGRLPGLGRLVLFESADYQVPTFLRVAAQKGAEIFGLPRYAADLLSPEAITHYFESLYWSQSERMDKCGILGTLIPLKRPRSADDFLAFQFKTIGDEFRVIDANTLNVIIPYGEKGCALCEAFRAEHALGRQRELLRQLQRYSVTLYGSEPRDAVGNLFAERVHDVCWILTSPEINYSDEYGVISGGLSPVLQC